MHLLRRYGRVVTYWMAWIGLAGAAAQLGALIWVWRKLRRAWSARWSTHDLSPGLIRLRAWFATRFRKSARPAESSQGDVRYTDSDFGWVSVAMADPTIESRVDALERNLQFLEERLSARQHEANDSIVRLTEAHQREVENSDRDARENTRLALTGPAVLAIAGALLQTTAGVLAVFLAHTPSLPI